MKRMNMEFYDAFQFLKRHRIFRGRFLEGLDIAVVKVSPKTRRIEDDPAENTLTQVWLEVGPLRNEKNVGMQQPVWTHDLDLDCGGNTFEEATCRLAERVLKKYGWDQI